MTSDDLQRRMDAARVRADLTVQDLWLRYLALGGTGDAFDLDGYLQGLVPLDAFQQDILAQALNEALEDSYRAYRIPLSSPPPTDAVQEPFDRLVDDLLDRGAPASAEQSEPRGSGPE
jgi:hypothetical protein